MFIIVGISKKQTIQSTILVRIIVTVCIVIVCVYAFAHVCAQNFDDLFQHMFVLLEY